MYSGTDVLRMCASAKHVVAGLPLPPHSKSHHLVHLHMYACVCVCVFVCVCVCVCARARAWVCVCVRACVRARVRACVHGGWCVCTYAYTFMCVRARAHTHIHTHIHTHTYIHDLIGGEVMKQGYDLPGYPGHRQAIAHHETKLSPTQFAVPCKICGAHQFQE